MKPKYCFVRLRASRRQLIPGILAAALAFALGVKPAQAQTNGTWDGGGASGIWGGTGNWNPDGQIATGVGATATFANTYGTYADQYNIIVNTVRTVGNINFTGTSNNITISRNSTNTLTLDVTSGSPTITVSNSARTLTMTTPVLGADGLTKAGAGTLVLSGSNTYTGTTIVSAGNLVAGANAPSAAAGALGNSATEVQLGVAGGNNNAGILINGAFTVGRIIRIPTSDGSDAGTRVLTLGGSTAADSVFSGNIFLGTTNQAGRGVTLTAATSGQTTFSGIIQNPTGMDATSYTVTKSGAGAVVLTGANTFTGNITVSAGTLIGAGATNSPGVTVFGSRDNTRTITVNSTGTLRFDSGNVLGANHSSTTAPTLVINAGGTVTNASPATNNALNNVQINGGTLTATTGSASGYGAWNINGNVTSTGTSTISTSDAVNGTVMLKVAGTTDFDVQSGTLNVSAPLIDNMNDTNFGALSKSGAGTMVLSAPNTYSGSTTVTGGTLSLSGTGASNTSSGITINGTDAKLLQGSTVAMTPTVTLTQGTLTGNGTVNTVNVGAGTGGIISNNNNVAGAALTIGALTFDGAATVNTFGNASAPIVTTSIATNAAGMVTINPAATSWAAGTYDLVTYGGGSIGGAGFGQFQLGTVTGASSRQSKVLGNSGSAITLTVGADDTPYWVGDGDGKWNLASTNNWKLTSDNSYTTFLATDNVLFNDSATGAGPIAVDIDLANVAPNSTTFANTTKDYVLSGAFGISTGSLTKSGTGTLTITNANTSTGNTIINGGVLDVSTDGAQLYSGASPVAASVTVTNGGVLVVKQFGQGATTGAGSPSLGNLNNSGGQVNIDGGTLRFNNETGSRGRVINVGANGATLDVVNSSTYTWTVSPGSSVPFTGSGQTLTLTGDATSTGTINLVIGGTDVSLLKTGAATWTLAGANTYTGNTNISAGTLSMSQNRITTSPTIFIGNGATWNSTGGLTLAANQVVTGTGATGSVTTTASTGLITTSGSTISTSGALSITRLSILGTDNQITGGNIQSGGSGTSQRGLLVGNGNTGVLTITGGTLTTNGTGANADILGNTASAGDGTLVINGGNYVAAGAGTLNIGNTSASGTLTVTSGSATVPTIIYNAGTTGTKTSAIVNLDGGILTLNNIVVTSGTTKEFNFNGGQLIAGANLSAFSGLTMNVKDGGANINTNGFSLGISDPLLNSGTGGLVKSGLGTLTLSGVNTYIGGTSVTGGSLRFSTAATSATDVTVSGGAEAGALVAVDNAQWVNTGNLTLQNNGAALVDYGSTAPSVTTAPVSVTNFVNGTTPGVRLAGAAVPALTVGQTLPLITWSGTGPSDGSAFDLRTHRLFGTFSVASNTLSLTITKNAIGAIAWNTGNGTWNTAAANWVDEDLAATTYIDPLDAVIFGDAAGVSGNPVVTLATNLSPVSTTMNTTGRNYTVSGAGSIGGSGALTLDAANLGTFTLATANNSFSGGTAINGGTLVLGDATNTLPDTGAVTVDGASAILSLGANNDTVGAVSLKNGAAITGTGSGTLTGSSYAFESGSVSANLAGTTGLAKSTSGTVILSGANTFTGSTALTGGTLRLANTAALANAANILATTASSSLELGTDTPFTTLPLVSGGSGALTYTIVSDRATPGMGLLHELGAMNFGSATFSFISGTNVTSGTAGIKVTSSNMTSGSAGTAILNPTTAALTITGGVTSAGSNWARTLQLDGTGTGHSIGGVITQSVTSALSLSKTGTSTWTLSGLSDIAANNYSGATTIDEGTLVFTTTSPSLTGGLTFGASTGSTNVGSLDLTNASATFGGGLAVRTNSASNNVVTIGSGQTLTFTGSSLTNAVTVGSTTDGLSALFQATGNGTLTVNESTRNLVVANSFDATGTAQMDLSGLANFNATVANIYVGRPTSAAGAAAGGRPSDSLILAGNNNITASGNIVVGAQGAVGFSATNFFTLGTANTINANNIYVGNGRSGGNVSFKTGLTNPSVTLRGAAGGASRTNIVLGDQLNASGVGNGVGGSNQTTGTMNFTDGTVDALIGSLTLGNGAAAASNNRGRGIGNFTFGAGSSVDIDTLIIGQSGNNNTTSSNLNQSPALAGTGTFTMNGGTLQVNTGITIANDIDPTNTASGILNVTGNFNQTAGTATVGTIDTPVNILMGNHLAAANSGLATATMNLTGGTLNVFGNIQEGNLGAGTITSNLTINGCALDMKGYSIGVLGSLIDNLNMQSGNLSNVSEINNGAGWIKSTTGTLVLAGTNSYTGTATVNGGILSITGTLNSLSSLAVGGGTVSFSGAALQTVSGLTINAGASTVTNTNAGATNVLNVGAITRNIGGIVNFANSTASNNVIQTSTANTNGILGTWAFVGSDFAMNDGSGNIVAYNGYTNVTRLTPGVIADGATTNVRIVEGSGSPGNITLGAPITTINSLQQSDSGGTSAATIDTSAGTLSTEAIVMTTAAGSLTVGTAPNSGILTPTTAGGDLVLTNNSAGNPMIINSAVADNTTASALIKTGVGTVILSGTNTYTGTTTVNDGTLRLGGSVVSATALVSNGTLQTAGNLPATAAVTLSGTSTLDLFGASQTVASLANVATSTLTNSSSGIHASTATTSGSPALTDALTITAAVTANSLPLLVTDGPTRKTQVILNNANGNSIGFFLTNNANTFSGGVVLAHNATTGTRLLLNGTNNGSVGTGPVIIGQADTDKAGVYFNAANTFANDIVFNTALGTDRVGLRADAAITLSGKITANLAPATFTSNSGTGGNITLTGQITGASGLVLDITSLSAAATNFNVTLNNAGTPNNYGGDTVINLAAASGKSATLNLGAAEQIPHGAATGNVVINSNGTGAGTLNLGGFSETINGLSGNGIVESGSGTPTLTLGANNATASFSGAISNTAGTLALVKTGLGTQTLSGVNTYTGTTTVSQGTLAFIGGSLTSPITVSAGASLSFDVGATTTSSSSVDITTGTIKITGTPTLNSYDLITSSGGITGTPVLDAPITGYDLKVEGNTLKLVKAGYAAWAAINAIGSAANLDKDGDGVNNAVEYVLGGDVNTNDLSKLPQSTISGTNLVFTFQRKVDTIDGSTIVEIEVGTNLTTWPTVYSVGANTAGSSAGVVVAEDTSPGFDTITLTVPMGTDPTKFARLSVEVP